MADLWIMGHIKWLFVYVICFSSRNVFCDLSLNMEPTVTGVRSLSVVIPCKYARSKDYEEVKVEWSLSSEVIIYRTEGQDHIPLVKFRDRVEISKSPGDASLTVRKLSITDKGNVKCKVTWKKNDGNLISKEDITELKVLRVKPATEKPKENVITTTHQEHETMKHTTDKPIENIITTIHQELKTTMPDTRLHDSTTLPQVSTTSTMERTEHEDIKEFHKSTIVIPLYDTEIPYSNVEAQNKVFGIPLYILIIIIISALCITTVITVLIITKKKRKDYIYELPTMNQLLALEGARNRCQSCTNETRASNNYEECNLPQEGVYEGIVLPYQSEYELLIVENTPENNCS